MNISSKAVPLGNILSDKWVNGNIDYYFLRVATAFDVFGTDNAGELDTCGF
jgi:hypothetical protein